MPYRGMVFPARIDTGILRSPGIDWGAKLQIIAQHKKQLVVRRKGHQTWISRGMAGYAPTLFMRLLLKKDNATVLNFYEPGRTWRDAVKILIDAAIAEAP